MRARLVPADPGQEIELAKDLTLVGRDAICDARLEHKSVSKLHCVLVKSDGLVLVRDLGSTNGTRVNGTRIRRAALLPDDWLMIASVRYAVKFGSALDTLSEPPPVPDLLQPEGSGDHPAAPPAPVSGPPTKRNLLPDR